jgi:hypothetical protein
MSRARYLPEFNQIWDFSTDFHKKFTIKNFTEFHPAEEAPINVDGQIERDRQTGRRADVTKVIGALRDCTKASKNEARIYRTLAFLSNFVLFFIIF